MMICVLSFFIYLTTSRFYEVVAITAVKESTVQLECQYKDTGAGTLDWSFKSTTSSTFVGYTTNAEKYPGISSEVSTRLTVTGNHAIGQYHLSISDIRESDQGMYKCIDGASGNEQGQTLVIIVGPTAVSLDNVTPDNKIPGTEGRQMTIKCTAVGGQPDPDVELIVLGLPHNGKKSAQHIFTPVAGDDGSNVTCKAGYKDIEFFPLHTSAYIHLNLIPSIFPFGFDTLDTGETKYIDVSCKSTGSRPAASIYWLLGKNRFNVTSNSTSQPIHDSSKDMYTVTSSLKYKVARRYNGQKLICRAFNNAGYNETSLTLNVTYAPDVTVENKTFSQIQSSRQIYSTVDSNPPVNTYKWQQRSKYGEHIRDFSDNNQILTLPTVSEDQSYQDTGEYVCTADNGIIAINGQLQQTGSGYLISNAPPVVTDDNRDHSTQYGMFGKSTEIKVNVYSIPKFTHKRWYKGNTHLVSNKYVIKEELALVKDVFHGVEVQLDGFRITLTVLDLQETDFTNYTLRLMYSSSQYVQHEVTLESASAPETPSNFTIISSSETSITVQWIPGYDGGQTQKFYIEYRITGSSEWLPQEVKSSNQIYSRMVYTLTGFQDKTSYDLRLYAKNKFNQSQHTDIETIRTAEAITSSNATIGTVAGVLVVLLVVCAVIISILIYKKRKDKNSTKINAAFYENSGFQNAQIGDEYEEVVSKSDTQEKQTSKTYEALRTKEAIGVYDDLKNSKGLQSTNSTSKTYESLGTKDAVETYDDLDHHKGLPSKKPSVDHYEALDSQDKPNVYEELESQKGPAEKVYVNEAF